MLLAGLGIGGHSLRSMWQERRPRLALKDMEEEEARLLSESYDKAVTDFRCLEEARKSLGDRELMMHLSRMQHISRNMIAYLEKHPKKLPLAERFIDYYQDRACRLVQKYQELESTELSTDKVEELKVRMKATLAGLDDAYEEQFERILGDQMLSADAELKVMEQQLGSQGIKIKKEPPPMAATRSEDKADKGEIMDTAGKGFSFEGLMESISPSKGRDPQGAVTGNSPVPGSWRTVESYGKPSMIPSEEKGEVIRRKVIQTILSMLLGTFGAHKFYQGKSFQGVLYALFCWTGLPTVISFVEGIRYMVMPMEDFYLQYVRKEDQYAGHKLG